jgi:regulator of ribonuclease activity A
MSVPRTSPGIYHRAMSFKTTDLCDASAEVHVCELPFVGIGRRRAFAGSIRTARYRDGISVLRDMINQPGHGQVLVIDGAGLKWRALFGDVMARLAVRNGWAGVVVHGQIRDRAELDTMDIGVKALGTAPRRADIGGLGEADVTVAFGGVTFMPGQRLVADEDGVVVLPIGVIESDIDIANSLAATAAYVSAKSSTSAGPTPSLNASA